MRKWINGVILIPLAAILLIFAFANRHYVTISLDPFSTLDPALAVTLPLFILIIVIAIVGVVVGGLAAWLGQRHWRRAARQCRAELIQARAELQRQSGRDIAAGPGSFPR